MPAIAALQNLPGRARESRPRIWHQSPDSPSACRLCRIAEPEIAAALRTGTALAPPTSGRLDLLPGADNQSVQLLRELVRISGNVQLLEVWMPNPSAKDSYVRKPAVTYLIGKGSVWR